MIGWPWQPSSTHPWAQVVGAGLRGLLHDEGPLGETTRVG